MNGKERKVKSIDEIVSDDTNFDKNYNLLDPDILKNHQMIYRYQSSH